MRLIVLSLGILWLIVMAIFGTLLAWKPDLALRFHDTFMDRTRRGKSLAWRLDVHTLEYRALGVAFVLVAVFMLLFIFKRLLEGSVAL